MPFAAVPWLVVDHVCPCCTRRNLHRAYSRTRMGNYALSGLVGFQMFRKTVGIIGTGAIGAEAARILQVCVVCGGGGRAETQLLCLQGVHGWASPWGGHAPCTPRIHTCSWHKREGMGSVRRGVFAACSKVSRLYVSVLQGVGCPHEMPGTCACMHACAHPNARVYMCVYVCLPQGIGCRVLAYDIRPNPAVEELGVPYLGLEEVGGWV